MSRARKTASFAGGLRGAAIGLAGALGIAVLVFGPALRAEAQAPAPAAPPDLRFQEIDPKLYATARAYFPADAGAAAPKRIFRLTRDQLDATVATLLPGYFPGSIKATMARDPLQTNYEYAELLSLNAANLGALTAWVGEIAARVRKNPSGVVDCARVNNSEACLKTEARRFVERALRGDVTEEKLDRLVKFYLDGQAHPRAGKTFGSDVSNKKTNGVNKSDDQACRWAAMSALVSFQQAAKQHGANAVIDLVSYYKKIESKDAKNYQCHAGGIIVGVTLKGTYATVGGK